MNKITLGYKIFLIYTLTFILCKDIFSFVATFKFSDIGLHHYGVLHRLKVKI